MSLLWEKLVRPAMFRLDAEAAHELGMKALRSGLAAPFYADSRRFGLGPVKRFGLEFANPVGLAAGFDKNAVAVDQLASLGFGFVEIGTVTHYPQVGNPKPRMFRLPEDQALINRLGFNNEGAEAIASRLSRLKAECVLGINIGKNKDVPIENATENYLASFKLLRPFADYVAINISSPNTPNLRELQRSENLDELLSSLQEQNREMAEPGGNAGVNERGNRESRTSPRVSKGDTPKLIVSPLLTRGLVRGKPLLVKIAPDLSEGKIEAAVDICLKHDISGIIATNTTIERDGLQTSDVSKIGAGGLSGRPLTMRSNDVISTVYKYTKAKVPIIGVGGIFTAQDAFDKIAAGATLLQAYTGFVYGGPTFARDVNEGLAKILNERGFSGLDEAVGSGVSGD